MKRILLFFCCSTALFLNTLTSSAQSYMLDKTIALPGNGGYDYVFIDQVNHRLYASHGTAVNVVDLQTEKVIGTISGMKGVHGIAVANDLNRGFITDGKANAVVAFDINTLKIIKTIPLTGNGPDGIIYDPSSKKIFAFEGDSNSAAVIDPKELKQTGSVALGGGPEFAVADGKGLIYNNLEDKNSLNVIDTKTLKVIHNYPLEPCGGPTGIAMDKDNQRLFTVCRKNTGMSVIDAQTGKVIQTLPIGAGVDAVVYNAAAKLIIASNGDGTATVFKQKSADSYELVQTLKTQYRAKTMALDTTTHKLYLPVADYQPGTKTQIADTFKLLVFTLK
ncbi:YncE family protein [Mucilaginibacter sp. X5P1]|uniref:YncE family protein n=1 Tax=Mucilaginibacter sp. X5P1 TaxID=2723088 RepID=UPI00160C67CD|nr:YncE family protein [Mucilaginibacter sp. X5P1]MBB6140140.1 DNA-binding beta-propeller fold protein YncE [Mucilaginibacter sp. X5P1]